MKEKSHNYFYKITNLVNSKYYYGIHSTNNLDDGYMGGGTALKNAIKKYGKENFIKEIIADYATRKEASDHEKTIVTLELIKLEECYNCRTGGDNEYAQSKKTREKISISRIGKYTGEENHFYGKTHTEESKQKIGAASIRRKHSDETRKKLSEMGVGKRCGEKNPMFGKILSEERKQKISEINKGYKHSDEAKLKISAKNKGLKRNEDQCKRYSEAQKGKKYSMERVEQMRNNNILSKPCLIMGIYYISTSAAGRHLNLPCSTVRCRLKSKRTKFKDWKYVEEV